MASIVQKYLTQDLSENEKKSYIEYINGNENSIDWIEKSLLRREPLLLLELQCKKKTDKGICNKWINIGETGVCICLNGHDCYDVILPVLKSIK